MAQCHSPGDSIGIAYAVAWESRDKGNDESTTTPGPPQGIASHPSTFLGRVLWRPERSRSVAVGLVLEARSLDTERSRSLAVSLVLEARSLDTERSRNLAVGLVLEARSLESERSRNAAKMNVRITVRTAFPKHHIWSYSSRKQRNQFGTNCCGDVFLQSRVQKPNGDFVNNLGMNF
mgnify:CR=1 FL=1